MPSPVVERGALRSLLAAEVKGTPMEGIRELEDELLGPLPVTPRPSDDVDVEPLVDALIDEHSKLQHAERESERVRFQLD